MQKVKQLIKEFRDSVENDSILTFEERCMPDLPKLLDAVEILVEGLELCALDSVVATDFREEYFLSVKNAKEALQLAEEKVSDER